MIQITNHINNNLKCLIKQSYLSIKNNLLNNKFDHINHINIYHKYWLNNQIAQLTQPNPTTNIIKILEKEYNIKPKSILSLGFINAPPKCNNQHFHIDYNGKTDTYFIPLINLDNSNGTEYVEFNNKKLNIHYFDDLKKISEKHITRDQVINEFNNLGINKSHYKFQILNTDSYSMVKMPYYLLHRGKTNESNYHRIMFQIVISKFNDVIISEDIMIDDSELDEDLEKVTKILIQRNKTNNFEQ